MATATTLRALRSSTVTAAIATASITATLTGRPKIGFALGITAGAVAIGNRRGVDWSALAARVTNPWTTIARDERATWRAARTLQDLCDLTIRWLTGDLKTQPGYCHHGCDVDPVPHLKDALVALNRAALLTRGSQGGHDGPGDGPVAHWHWVQVAAVEGLATPATVARLRAALHDTPYSIEAHPRPRIFDRDRREVPVTWVRDHPAARLDPHTHFGGFGRRSDLEFQLDGAGCDAVEEAVDALQVVIYDPAPGRNTLWPDLLAVLGATPRTADDTEVTA